MSLPDLTEIPEGLSDQDIFLFIENTFRVTKSSESAQFDVNEDIAWLLKVIIARGEDKSIILFHCGLIFLNPVVLLNANMLAHVMSYQSGDVITRRIKHWQQIQWETDEKLSVLNLYDSDLDPKTWSVRQPSQDTVFFKTGNFRPMYQIAQRIPEVNTVPLPKVKPPTLVNVTKMIERRFYTEPEPDRPYSHEEPVTWKFDTDAVHKINML